MRSDCVCQNWRHGHREAALNERLPSLVCVLPVVSRFQMKGAKREKNERSVNQSLLGSIIGKCYLLALHQLPFTCLPPCLLQLSLLPQELMRLFLCSVAAPASMCKARPFNWFPSLDFGQARQLAVATRLSHKAFSIFLLPSQPGHVINWAWAGGGQGGMAGLQTLDLQWSSLESCTMEQPGELSDL